MSDHYEEGSGGTGNWGPGKWLDNDPPRIHEIRPEIERWKKHFRLSKERPVALDDFDGDGTEKLVWWREFLIETGQISARDVHRT